MFLNSLHVYLFIITKIIAKSQSEISTLSQMTFREIARLNSTGSFALIGQAISEKNTFENNGYIHVYSPGAGQTTPWSICFLITQLFSQFSPLLQVFQIK